MHIQLNFSKNTLANSGVCNWHWVIRSDSGSRLPEFTRRYQPGFITSNSHAQPASQMRIGLTCYVNWMQRERSYSVDHQTTSNIPSKCTVSWTPAKCVVCFMVGLTCYHLLLPLLTVCVLYYIACIPDNHLARHATRNHAWILRVATDILCGDCSTNWSVQLAKY